MANAQQVLDQGDLESPGAEADRKKALREIVDLIFPDSLMIVLAGIMVPLILIPLIVDLSDSVTSFVEFADYVILSVFVLEYVLKTILARDVLRHVLDPWHLLDLLIVALPFASLLPAVPAGWAFPPRCCAWRE
ncbi:MAG: ion transporter [Chloroflexi bacterium]|nr:ion transporter [Chloroflexota bacterium]